MQLIGYAINKHHADMKSSTENILTNKYLTNKYATKICSFMLDSV